MRPSRRDVFVLESIKDSTIQRQATEDCGGRLEDISQLLRAWSDGDERALNELTPVIYAELHRLAHRYMRRERKSGCIAS